MRAESMDDTTEKSQNFLPPPSVQAFIKKSH